MRFFGKIIHSEIMINSRLTFYLKVVHKCTIIYVVEQYYDV